MNGVTIYEYLIPLAGVPKTVLYQFNDLHLAVADEFSDDEDKAMAERSIEGWNRGRISFASAYGEPTGEEQLLPTTEQLRKMLSVIGDADALLLAGDIVDYPSEANYRHLNKRLAEVQIPILSVCGNHEDPIADPVQVLEFEGFTVVGLDDARREITAEQNEQLRAILAKGKPVFLLMHVPVFAPGYEHLFRFCDEYYRLNHSKATDETKRFLDILQQHTAQIKGIFAGHLHFNSVTQVAPETKQYVCTQGVIAGMNRYVIGE